jgi:homocitrate synthase NifV
VGLTRSIVIGKHSGTKTLITDLAKRNIELPREDAEKLLVMVRKASVFLHRHLTSDELYFLYQDMVNGKDTFDDNVQ